MRTTLDLDETLLERAKALFPSGTAKTVLVEEALRRLVDAPTPPAARGDPRLDRLVDQGLLTRASVSGPLLERPASGTLPLEALLHDLARDREDR